MKRTISRILAQLSEQDRNKIEMELAGLVIQAMGRYHATK